MTSKKLFHCKGTKDWILYSSVPKNECLDIKKITKLIKKKPIIHVLTLVQGKNNFYGILKKKTLMKATMNIKLSMPLTNLQYLNEQKYVLIKGTWS